MFSHEKIINDHSRARKFFEDIVSYTVGPFTLDDIIENKTNSINIIDVREYNDYLDGHIPYAMHMPYKELEDNLEILDKDKITVVYTYSDSCPRAYKTALELSDKHYSSVVLRGGFREWKKFDLDVIKSNSSDYDEAMPNE